MAVVRENGGRLVTHALGSCIGITIYDAAAGVGGLLHFMLPKPQKNAGPHKPYMYGSEAIPALFREAYQLGAKKERLVVCAAGAAMLLGKEGGLQVGKRNRTMMRQLFWKNDIVLAAEDTEGDRARTMSLDLATGEVSIRMHDGLKVLWPT